MNTHIAIRPVLGLLFIAAVSGMVHAAEPVAKGAPSQKQIEDRLGEMITIPAGKFLMGNNGKEGFNNPDELPQHWVDLPAYQIGKCEVTRGQYRKFIEAGGYKDPRYWSAEGWKWKQGNTSDYAGMQGKVTRVARPADAPERN